MVSGSQFRKPRLALMGEFSAGKSTLSNLLLGSAPLPTRVTATRLPPVWLSHGSGCARRIDPEGNSHDLALADLNGISPDSTRLVQLEIASEMLELCDLIDLPGISDPNMPADLWQSVMDEVDQVVWCTHATQAWRQSEAAAWDSVRARTNGNNLLLVTQIDKLTSQRDRDRVMARVRSETADLFAGHYAISLTGALAAGEDEAAWRDSGADAFTNRLIDMLLSSAAGPAETGAETPPEVDVSDLSVDGSPAAESAIDAAQIAPKRVRNRIGERLRTRPVSAGFDMADLAVRAGDGR